MTCLNSVTTSTGKFTLYYDRVSRCQAKKRCKESGQILAPIKNKSDLDAIINLQKNNDYSESCVWGNAYWGKYHVGLDVKNVGGTLFREFTDGTKWDECEMGDLYLVNQPHKCPRALYENLKGAELSIAPENYECNSKTALAQYICLKPAENTSVTSAEHLVQGNSGSNSFILTTAIGGAAFMAVCVFATVGLMIRMKNKVKNCEEEMKMMKKVIEEHIYGEKL